MEPRHSIKVQEVCDVIMSHINSSGNEQLEDRFSDWLSEHFYFIIEGMFDDEIDAFESGMAFFSTRSSSIVYYFNPFEGSRCYFTISESKAVDELYDWDNK